MDARKYDAIHHVAVGQFTKEQRQRLEAFTAATKLRRDAPVSEQIDIASFIVIG